MDVEYYEEGVGDHQQHGIHRVLLVIDIHSGAILQQVRVDLVEEIAAILVHGDEIYIAGFTESEVVVLPFAGSEA